MSRDEAWGFIYLYLLSARGSGLAGDWEYDAPQQTEDLVNQIYGDD